MGRDRGRGSPEPGSPTDIDFLDVGEVANRTSTRHCAATDRLLALTAGDLADTHPIAALSAVPDVVEAAVRAGRRRGDQRATGPLPRLGRHRPDRGPARAARPLPGVARRATTRSGLRRGNRTRRRNRGEGPPAPARSTQRSGRCNSTAPAAAGVWRLGGGHRQPTPAFRGWLCRQRADAT